MSQVHPAGQKDKEIHLAEIKEMQVCMQHKLGFTQSFRLQYSSCNNGFTSAITENCHDEDGQQDPPRSEAEALTPIFHESFFYLFEGG